MKPPSDDFMRHFRWLTPLLLGLCVFLLQDIYFDFKKLKLDFIDLQIKVAVGNALAAKRARD